MTDNIAKPLSREDAVSRLKGLEFEIRAMGIVSLFLFGSVARNEARPESDVDLFGDLDPSRRFGFDYFSLSGRIGDLIGHKVDFMSRESLHPMLKDRIVVSRANIF